MSGIGNANEQRSPVNRHRAYDRDEKQQQREPNSEGRQIEVDTELFDQDIIRHAHVRVRHRCVETGAFGVVAIIEAIVSNMHTGCRLISIGTEMHVHAANPHDQYGYADEPDEQLGVTEGHPDILGGMA